MINLDMIMVPAQNIFKQLLEHPKGNCNDSYVSGEESYKGINGVGNTTLTPSSWYHDDPNGGGGGGGEGIGSDHLGMVDDHGQPMEGAEDESRTSSVNESSSSKGNTTTTTTTILKDDDTRWLQLGLGGSHDQLNYKLDDRRIDPNTTTQTRNDLVELNLFAGANNNTQHVIKQPMITTPPNMDTISTPSLFLSQPRSNFSSNFLHQQQEVVSWGYRPNPWNPIASTSSTSTSSSNSLLPMASPSPSYQQQQRFQHHNNTVMDMLSPNSDLKVVNPPRRPHSGVWVILQASQNQDIEPCLPQIPKNYLRIKDGKTTVRLLMKYLVNKLKLHSESEYHGNVSR
ncbi:hypothetical protein MKW94_023772 [Papaver nudicaule]|uniref:Uncharacterized protein n=1 Tax=Papaver nudicaule TaxID=74823 RepID=A0AA41VRR2_PAPNU|nr:hypothetical protein [Papaver nudicaule]